MPREWLKLCIVVILVLSLAFSPLHFARAVSGWLIVLKEYALDTLARVIGRVLFSVLSNTIVGKILILGRTDASGVGGPAFIQDWRDFLAGAQYRGEDTFRAQLADAIDPVSGTVCQYLRSSLDTAFGAAKIPGFDSSKYRIDALQYFNVRNRCSLPSGFDVNVFRNDFSQGGGWATWEKLIQPQNNFYGVYADSMAELENQREFEEKLDTSEAESGSGYTSKRTGCSGSGENRQCTILGKVVTPGDLFGKTGAATIDRELDWLVSSDELEEVIVDVAGTLVNRLVNFAVESVVPSTRNITGDASRVPPDAVGRSQLDCVQTKEPGCTLKAKNLQCDVSADGGDGGGGGADAGAGGSGGSANANCVEVIDQGVYDACMAEARAACGF